MTAAGPTDLPSPRRSWRSFPDHSLGRALDGHRNSLGLLRLALATLVIFDHAFPLGGFGEDPFWQYTRGQTSLGGIAVGGFFVISGYLIVKSGASADIIQFLWRRVIRIFPAFWGVLAFGAFVVGPLAWLRRGSELSDYFVWTSNGPFAYITANWTLTINNYGILDVFSGTPYGQQLGGASVLNGSLWTLAYEWGCYMLVAVLAIAGVLSRARIIVPVLTGLVLVAQAISLAAPGSIAQVLPLLGDPQVLFLALAFLVGSTFGIYSDTVAFDDRIGIGAIAVFIATALTGGFLTLGIVAGGYAVLYLAARLPRSVQWIGARNDYSYGVYVYGFLVQQSLAAAGANQWGYVPYVSLTIVITFGLAWLSWHCLEKHALALKSWGPGKGLPWLLRRGSSSWGGTPHKLSEKDSTDGAAR
ncbi:acyltransferase family protein [Microbacterium lacus]|uniref:acyltransferase family protein n=1 Tax=Microbacterium lacus TaxID=415217 RepID=UPI000C2CBFB7|nr:acyltransferase [Microbacterium lacus]